MALLQNFALKNQRITTNSSGQIDVNADYDCVPTCIAAGMQFLTGQHFEGGILKEIAYGRDYQGPTSAAAYVQYAAQHGIRLYPVQGDNATLVSQAHKHIQAGHPVILTEPDPYIDLSKYPGATHVLVFFEENASTLTALDPFGGYAVTLSDRDWINTLVDGEIWVLENIRKDETVNITLQTPGVSTFFSQAPGNAWKCNKNGLVIGNAVLNFYRMFGNSALCGLTYLGLPLTNEYGVAGHSGVTEQRFERGTLRYDPQHQVENPPGSGVVYVANISALQTGQQGVDASARAQLNQVQGLLIDYQHKLSSIREIVK